MTAIAVNETVTGLPQFGTQLGDFFGNTVTGMAPGLIIMAIIVGVIGIIGGVIYMVKNFLTKAYK